MSSFDFAGVGYRLAVADSLPPSQKGLAMEDLIADLFSLLPGCSLELRRSRDRVVAREVDLVFRVSPPGPVPGYFDSELIVECKNLSAPVSPEQVTAFARKLRLAGQRAGVLIASSGISGSDEPARGAHDIIDDERRDGGPCIAVVTREELERISSVEVLAALLSRKLVQVRVNGRVWLADTKAFAILEAENPGAGLGTVDVAQIVSDREQPALELEPAPEPEPEPEAEIGAEIGAEVEAALRADVVPRIGLFSYNARRLTSEELGRSYVPHPLYARLAGNSHTLLVGPRGSGRTTMLRMLTPKAQAASWDPEVREIAAHTNHIAVWIDSGVAQVSHPDSTLQALLFTSEVLRTFARAVAEEIESTGATQVEQEVAAGIARIMEIEGEVSTLDDLDRQLVSLKADVMFARDSGDIRLPVDLTLVVRAAIEVVNSALGKPDQRWCLIFDELELADWEVTAQILSAMRSSDPTLILKAAILPQSDPRLSDPQLAPLAGQDFLLLDLRRPPSERAFVSELARRRIEAHGFADSRLDAVLGGSADGTGAAGSLEQAVARLTAVDPEFEAWDARAEDQSPAERSARMRKASAVIRIRSEALVGSTKGRRRPARKWSYVWTGADAVLAMADGSPRRLLVMLDSMLERAQSGRVSRGAQTEVIARDQLALLSTLAGATSSRSGVQLIEQIGSAMEASVVGGSFNPDPVTSFVIDAEVDLETRSQIQIALNLGVLVPIESAQSLPLREVSGARLRLAYLLAPRFCLPLRVGRPCPLTRLIRGDIGTSDR